MSDSVSDDDLKYIQRTRRLAAQTLRAALDDDFDRLKELTDEIDGDDLYGVVMAWIDIYINYTGVTDLVADGAGAILRNTESGEITELHSGDAPPHIRWAARLIHARFSHDRDAFHAVWRELEHMTEDEPRSCIISVLHCCAESIKMAAREMLTFASPN